jgi:hypothetical protein
MSKPVGRTPAARIRRRSDAGARRRTATSRYALRGGNPLPANTVRRGPGRPRGSKNKSNFAATAKSKQKRKNSWAGLSAAARLARVNAIRKGKGLPPRSA